MAILGLFPVLELPFELGTWGGTPKANLHVAAWVCSLGGHQDKGAFGCPLHQGQESCFNSLSFPQ